MAPSLTVTLAVLALASVALGAQLAPWSPEDYPNPMRDVDRCGRRGLTSWVCDPDGVLSWSSGNVVEGVLKAIAEGEQPYARAPCGTAGDQGFQVAVALMERFRRDPYEDAATTARKFAKALHDAWGVGRPECGNGVLLLLSVADRQVYISAGSGATLLLTDTMIGQIVDDMKTNLRNERYGDAVEGAVVDIGLVLAGKGVDHDHDGTFLFGFFASVVAAVFACSWVGSRAQRKRLRDCKGKLEQLKRDQAAMRDRRYVATSCPVCLDEFEADATLETPSAPPLPCTSAGSSSYVGEGDEGEATDNPASSLLGAGKGKAAGKSKAGGGKGNGKVAPAKKPLVLPCGHGFCEPCISEWMKSKSSCPICRKDINDDSDPDSSTYGSMCGQGAASSRQDQQQQQQRRRLQRLDEQLVQQELLFRLARLEIMFPDFVTPSLAAQWREDLDQGRTLSSDAINRLSLQDPAVRQNYEQQGSSGASFSFGGGGSGGGGGGGGSW